VTHFVFRADASSDIGWGHAMRCLALAETCREFGVEATFASAQMPAAVRRQLDAAAVPCLELPAGVGRSAEDAAATRAALRALPHRADWLVVDHYVLGADWEGAVAPEVGAILAVDDAPTRAHNCDALLDQTLGRGAGEYAGLVPPACRILSGASHAMLRRQFARARPNALARRHGRSGVKRVLVALGGGSAAPTLAAVLEGLTRTRARPQVDLILGSDERIPAAAERMPALEVHRSTEQVAGLMEHADVAIGAGGTSAWERCALALPALTVVLADNQRGVVRALERAGAALNLGEAAALTAGQVCAAIDALAEDPDALRAYARRAAQVCDGRGAERVYLALGRGERAADGTEVRLRMAATTDEAMLLAWQQDPVTRKFARNPQPPSPSEHHSWMERVLADPDRLLLIAQHASVPAGMLRLDALPAQGAREVSILVAPGRQRLGIGAAMLAAARGLFPAWRLEAEVLPGNDASHRLFRRVGYRALSSTRYVSDPVAEATS
jgi:UDP-2,4-diacetamido-2,4,6-trideoxy-beta-L-altropyranose hydrolase